MVLKSKSVYLCFYLCWVYARILQTNNYGKLKEKNYECAKQIKQLVVISLVTSGFAAVGAEHS